MGSSSFFENYLASFDVRNVTIEWERRSDLAPWHTWGTHRTNHDLEMILAGNYCDCWITSPVDLSVMWKPMSRGEADYVPRSSLELVLPWPHD